MRNSLLIKRLCFAIFILTCVNYWYGKRKYFDLETISTVKLGYVRKEYIDRSNRRIQNDICSCPLIINEVQREIEAFPKDQSSCSDQSTKYGSRQKVVSFSLFLSDVKQKVNPLDAQYFHGIEINAKKIQKFYPGWVMRIYTYPHPYWNNILCNLACKLPHVFLCNVESLPILGNVTNGIDAAVWRFLPLGDKTVETFVSRDLDSTFSSREKAAVTEWLDSDKTFHAMRDHPFHSNVMLAGTWGAKNTNESMVNKLRDTIIRYGSKSQAFFTKGYDQDFLAVFIFPQIKNHLLVHDSYYCERHNDSATAPFPLKRVNAVDYIGRRIFAPKTIQLVKEPCPLACRPPQGKHWIFC